MTDLKYKFLSHTADVKFRAYGNSMEEAFSNSALALAETMSKGEKIGQATRKKIKVSGKDNLKLLYNFMEEFLFLFDTSGFVLSKVGKIKIRDGKLEAEVYGEKKRISNDVKAVTYNEMLVKKEKGKWTCQVVLDV